MLCQQRQEAFSALPFAADGKVPRLGMLMALSPAAGGIELRAKAEPIAPDVTLSFLLGQEAARLG